MEKMYLRKIFAGFSVALVLAACQTTGNGIKLQDDSVLETFLYKPKEKGSYPAVIVLHHKGGMTDEIKIFAGVLSDENFVTLAVDYYSGNGWLSQKVGAAYDFLQKLPEVDPERIGMLGFSRGALEGTGIAIDWQNEYPIRPVRAMVSYYVGRGVNGASPDIPPILFLHGDRDIETPWKAVVEMCEELKRMGKICQAKIYENTRHAFTHASRYGGYDGQVSADAFKRAVAFLNRYLRNAPIRKMSAPNQKRTSE